MKRFGILVALPVLLLVLSGCGRDDSRVTGPTSTSTANKPIIAESPSITFPALTGILVDENFNDDNGDFVSFGGMGFWQPLPEGNWAFHSERGYEHPVTALVRGISYNLSDILTFRFEVTMKSGFGGPDNPVLNIGFSDGDYTTGDVDLGLAANSLVVSFTGAAGRFGIGARDKFSKQVSSMAPGSLIEDGGTYGVEGTYNPATGVYSCALFSLPGNYFIVRKTIDLSASAGFQGFSALTHFGILWPNFGGAVSAIEGTWDNVFVETRRARPLELNVDIKPGSCPNSFNPKSKGILLVAILGTPDLDVHDIDVSSLFLEGVAPVRSHIEDMSAPMTNGDECKCTVGHPDGYMDLTLKFEAQGIAEVIDGVAPGDQKMLTVTGQLLDGTPFETSDCIAVVGGRKVPLAPYELKFEEGIALGWFGGDDRHFPPPYPMSRNVGIGQEVLIDEEIYLDSFAFEFSQRFDYAQYPEGMGHDVTLALDIRDPSGAVLKTLLEYVPATFDGGWVTWDDIGMTVGRNQRLIFTAYLVGGYTNHYWTGYLADPDAGYLDGVGFTKEDRTNSGMQEWAGWAPHPWDSHFWLKGRVKPQEVRRGRSHQE